MNLNGKVCLVTGASRGIGRGIALQLVTHGAICYITGRDGSTLSLVQKEAETRGATGKCIPVECNHTSDESIEKLFQTISSEQNGQLDLLVNNAYSAVPYLAENSPKPFWDLSIDGWDIVNNVGLRNHYICAVHASRMMVSRRKGLIVNISSLAGKMYFEMPAFGIGKAAKDRMAHDCAVDLKRYNVAFVSLWPGVVKTETVLDLIDKAPESQVDQVKLYSWFLSHGESTEYAGKCIVHLLTDKHIMKKSGQILMTTDIGLERNFKDVDGAVPLSKRSLKFLFGAMRMFTLSDYIPSWLRIPRGIFLLLISLASGEMSRPKSISDYA